jgi:hypothetical protein
MEGILFHDVFLMDLHLADIIILYDYFSPCTVSYVIQNILVLVSKIKNPYY